MGYQIVASGTTTVQFQDTASTNVSLAIPFNTSQGPIGVSIPPNKDATLFYTGTGLGLQINNGSSQTIDVQVQYYQSTP